MILITISIYYSSYEYGPCVGMTRLERWERAHAFGLNPPPEVSPLPDFLL